MSIFATAVRCNVCRDTRKVTIDHQLYWCEFCCPAEVAGAETTPEAELPQPSTQMKRKPTLPSAGTISYNMSSSNVVFASIEPTVTAVSPDNIPNLEDGTLDPRYCESCASQNIIVRATVLEHQFHHWDLVEPDDDGEDYYNYLSLEGGYYDSNHLETQDQVFYCRDCGHTSSIGFDIEYD